VKHLLRSVSLSLAGSTAICSAKLKQDGLLVAYKYDWYLKQSGLTNRQALQIEYRSQEQVFKGLTLVTVKTF